MARFEVFAERQPWEEQQAPSPTEETFEPSSLEALALSRSRSPQSPTSPASNFGRRLSGDPSDPPPAWQRRPSVGHRSVRSTSSGSNYRREYQQPPFIVANASPPGKQPQQQFQPQPQQQQHRRPPPNLTMTRAAVAQGGPPRGGAVGGFASRPPPGSFPIPGTRRSRAGTAGSNRSSLISEGGMGLNSEELWALDDDTPDMSNPLRPSAERPLDTMYRMSQSFDHPSYGYPMGAENLWPTAPDEEMYPPGLQNKGSMTSLNNNVKKKRSILRKSSRGSGLDAPGPYPSSKDVVSSAHSSTTSLSFAMNKSQQSLSRPPSAAYSLDLLNALAPREGGYAIAAQLSGSFTTPTNSVHASPPNSFRAGRGPPAKSSGMRWSVGGDEYVPPLPPPPGPGRLSPSTTISNLSTYTDDADGASSSGPSSPHLQAVQSSIPVAPSPLSQQTTAAEINRTPLPSPGMPGMPTAAAAMATAAVAAPGAQEPSSNLSPRKSLTKSKSRKERKAEEKTDRLAAKEAEKRAKEAEKQAKLDAKRATEVAAREKSDAAKRATDRQAAEDKAAAARKAAEAKAEAAKKNSAGAGSRLDAPQPALARGLTHSGSFSRRMSNLFSSKPTAAEIAAGAAGAAAVGVTATVAAAHSNGHAATAAPAGRPVQPPQPVPSQPSAAPLPPTPAAAQQQQPKVLVPPQRPVIPTISQQPPSPPRAQPHPQRLQSLSSSQPGSPVRHQSPVGPRQQPVSPPRTPAAPAPQQQYSGDIVIPSRSTSMAGAQTPPQVQQVQAQALPKQALPKQAPQTPPAPQPIAKSPPKQAQQVNQVNQAPLKQALVAQAPAQASPPPPKPIDKSPPKQQAPQQARPPQMQPQVLAQSHLQARPEAPRGQSPSASRGQSPSNLSTSATSRGQSPSNLSTAPSQSSSTASSKKGLFSGLKKRFSIASMDTAPTAPARQRPASIAVTDSNANPKEKRLPHVPQPAPRPVIQAPKAPTQAPQQRPQAVSMPAPAAQRAQQSIPPPVIVPPRGSSMAMLSTQGLSPNAHSPLPPGREAERGTSLSSPSSVVVTPTTSNTTTPGNSLFDSRPTPPFRERSDSSTSTTGSSLVTNPSSVPQTDDEVMPVSKQPSSADAKAAANGNPLHALPAVAAH